MRRLLLAAAVSLSSTLSSTVALAAGSVADVPARADATADVDARFVDGSGRPIVDVIDGSIITLEIELAEPVTESARYHAHLLPQDVEVAACAVGPGSATCSAGPIDTLGWAWSDLGELLPIRRLELRSTRRAPLPLLLNVAPRPVVLVHGFTSSAAAWDAYVGPDGFLAGIGIDGFAVGDPSLGPAMNMGRTASPTAETNTLGQNAAVLAAVIDEVRQRTGATLVDVVAHSMGGLVARYYVAKLMDERSIAQLLLLGTPNLGSPCAALPSALGFYLPAALELRPSYLQAVFNPQVVDVGGVPVESLAGTPITERFRSPCTDVPSDLVVDLTSAAGISPSVTELPVLHTDQTGSSVVFESFVAPRLRRAPDAAVATDAPAVTAATAAQSTHAYSGTVMPGSTATLEIDLDAVAVAGFALFDPSRSLSVTVHGASGAEIVLTPAAHGLFTVGDPESLVHLGYGFANPRPGPWLVTLASGPLTPMAGAQFALMAHVVGGAVVTATVDEFLPLLGESIEVTAVLHDIDHGAAEVVAVVTGPDGATSSRAMRRVGDTWRVSWRPEQVGVHGIDVVVSGTSLGGLAVERTVALALEVRANGAGRNVPAVVLAAVVSLVSAGLAQRLGTARWQRSVSAER